jgi:putative sterol carrier protein
MVEFPVYTSFGGFLMADLTPRDIITHMPAAFVPAKADGVSADVQLHLTGDQGGDWVVSVRSGQCTVTQGTVANPKLNLTADARDFVGVVTGRVNPVMAFMSGKLKVKGDMSLAARFPSFFGASI